MPSLLFLLPLSFSLLPSLFSFSHIFFFLPVSLSFCFLSFLFISFFLSYSFLSISLTHVLFSYCSHCNV
ncbi:hypothetical protein RchiOBHm_Chr1g0316101 [Rosa chinensis]|uniref:Uncharacterized protein n=1 Tax=Rosa chinensis TaxID=74649 RepID=A0A2P6S7I9_ROSCH|nr:hypothetical protein RchiOBHm_Chr1g0316101 [Rosa chinensis]